VCEPGSIGAGGDYGLDKQPMNPPVGGEFGVKRCCHDGTLPDQDREVISPGQHLDVCASFNNAWSADKDHLQRRAVKRGFDGEDGGVDLAAVGVTFDDCIEQAKTSLGWIANFAGQQNGSGAGAENRMAGAKVFQGFKEAVLFEEAEDGCGFAAGEDEAVDAGQFVGFADLDRLRRHLGQGFGVSGVVALNGEDADAWGSSFGQFISSHAGG